MKLILLVPILLVLMLTPMRATAQDTQASFSRIANPAIAEFNAVVFQQDSDENLFTVSKRIFTDSGKVIGNGFSSCVIFTKGNRGGEIQQCHATFNLPKGKIATIGSRHSLQRYTWVIVGGTGFYNGVGGRLDAFRTGENPRTERLKFNLIP